MAFVHLHNHTEYSMLDGATKIKDMVRRAADLDMPAVAITDHGVMCGVPELCDACEAVEKETGKKVKPIYGCEIYFTEDPEIGSKVKSRLYHMVLLAKNNVGYHNLLHLVSESHCDNFYYKPRTTFDMLKKYAEGCIASSACIAGIIPRCIDARDFEGAEQWARKLASLYEPGDFYIELQDQGITTNGGMSQREMNGHLTDIANKLGLKTIATNDFHYLRREDARAQDLMLCIGTGSLMDDENRMRFANDQFYMKTEEEMREALRDFPEACDTTVEVAEKCNVVLERDSILPRFPLPPGYTEETLFRKECEDGLKRRYGEPIPKDAWDRYMYEAGVIIQQGFPAYFLIVQEYIRWARENGIAVGPGRGSGAGSIAAYCVGITDIDPIRYNLIFERFLNPERVSMPDFDVDFCYERRQEVIDYVNRKYGADHVAQIVTFGTMAARNAIRDVGRVMGMPYQSVDVVAKQVPMELKMTLKRALEVSPELKRMYDSDPQVTELIDTALKVEGMPRHASTHAAGVVITPEPTDYYLPLATNDGLPVTQFNMTEIEELGLLKMDFLGLRTLTVIRDAEAAIQKKDPSFSIRKLDYDDAATYKMLGQGETEGVFQLESSGMKQVLVGLQPQNLEDVIALISLYRPGPMDSIPTYLRNRHEPDKISYKTPQLAHILDVTNGCIVYQEQVMQIFRELAGFSFGQADNVRRAMSKKKHAVMEAEREHFVHGCTEPGHECPGCVANGISEKVANEIYDEMSSFASYAFNKSHAACYAYVAFQTAYLKCHYPSEFMAALLTSVLDNTDKVIEYSGECARLGIKVLPPDVNISNGGFTADNGKIRFGLNAVKNVGRNLIERVVEERKEKPYSSLYDFCKRMHGTELNRRAVECLIKAGAFDSMGVNRHSLVEAVDGIIKSVESDSRRNLEGQLDLFSVMSGESQTADTDSYEIKPFPEYSHTELLQQEKEVSGLYLSGHPLDAYREQSARFASNSIKELTGEDAHKLDGNHVRIVCTIVKNRMMTTKSNTMMAFTSVEDLTGTMEVIVFPRVLDTFRDALKENAVVVIEGRLSVREDEPSKLMAESISPIEGYDPKRPQANRPNLMRDAAQRLYVRLPSRSCPEYAKVINLLEIFDGDMPVIFYLEDVKQKLAAPRRLYASGHPLLFQELKRLLGERNVATK